MGKIGETILYLIICGIIAVPCFLLAKLFSGAGELGDEVSIFFNFIRYYVYSNSFYTPTC